MLGGNLRSVKAGRVLVPLGQVASGKFLNFVQVAVDDTSGSTLCIASSNHVSQVKGTRKRDPYATTSPQALAVWVPAGLPARPPLHPHQAGDGCHIVPGHRAGDSGGWS